MLTLKGKFRNGEDIWLVQNDFGFQEKTGSWLTVFEMENNQNLVVSYVPTGQYDLAERIATDVAALRANGVDTDTLTAEFQGREIAVFKKTEN